MKTLIALAFIGVVAFCAAKIVPVYVENFQLQDYIDHVAVQATAYPPHNKTEAIQNTILAKAESLGLPVERHDINVSISQTVSIRVDYSVYVDLRFYMLTLHFTPSTHSSSIV